MFDQTELGYIGQALAKLSQDLADVRNKALRDHDMPMAEEISRQRREVWYLRDKVKTIYDSMPSSAT